MNKGINVLSLFDGMSCGQQALERAGIQVENYFASEIDKYGIQITKKNYPNTIHLGDVRNIKSENLPKIDLLIGGSPCQSFSFAGKRKGMSTKDNVEILTLGHYLELKEQNFEFEGQSYLFWEYMRLLNEVKPKYFLLENVIMGEKWEQILSRAIGYNAIEINSSLVSAQNRRRLYWTNIGTQASGLFGFPTSIIEQPKDKGILLKDILETEVDEKYFLSENAVSKMNNWAERNKNNGNGFKPEYRTEDEKSSVVTTGSLKSNSTILKIDKKGNLKKNQDKASCFTAGANSGGNHSDMDLIVNKIEPNFNNKAVNRAIETHGENIEHGTLIDSYNNQIHKDKSITITTRVNASNCTHIVQKNSSEKKDVMNENQISKFDENIDVEKHNTLTTAIGRMGSSSEYMSSISKLAKITHSIRRLTPIECERLQTVKDNYTEGVSDTQRYKMLGNGWTVDVIAHIFSYLKF